MKKLKTIPKFITEDDEREFWTTHDSTDYIDWSKATKNPAMPNLKPSTKPVTVRLPESLLVDLKTLANKQDIPYQSYMKMILADKVKREYSTK